MKTLCGSASSEAVESRNVWIWTCMPNCPHLFHSRSSTGCFFLRESTCASAHDDATLTWVRLLCAIKHMLGPPVDPLAFLQPARELSVYIWISSVLSRHLQTLSAIPLCLTYISARITAFSSDGAGFDISASTSPC